MCFFLLALDSDDDDSDESVDGGSVFGFASVVVACVVYVYNDCHRRNHNHRSKMGRTSHISDAYDTFSSLCASFYLLLSPMTMTPTNQMTTVQGPGYFPVRMFSYDNNG